MNEQIKVIIKDGVDLSSEELNSINDSAVREFKVPPMSFKQQQKTIFVLIKDSQDKILAQGQLIPIDGVIFNGETFNILGIGGIISNIKGKGYGKYLMEAIKDYLKKVKKAGVGFTGVSEFYRKCGLVVDDPSLRRFVHVVDGKEITSLTEEAVFYTDSEDQFMKKVLENPDQKIYLPRDPDW